MPAKRIAFVTWSGLPDLSADDQTAAAELARRGSPVTAAIWDDPSIDWAGFDAVILRSSWDYHKRFTEFRRWLDRMETLRVNLWNPVSLLRRNIDKSYLLELDRAGVETLPMQLLRRGHHQNLARLMESIDWSAAVIKPTVSATAHRTLLVQLHEAAQKQNELDQLLRDTDVIAQQFAPEVVSEGEWSLIFLGGSFSHSVLKRPKEGDFRVQEDFGGSTLVREAPPGIRSGAEKALRSLSEPWIYARVDGIRIGDAFVLMELELTEPSLFLRADPQAPGRFAEAILARA